MASTPTLGIRREDKNRWERRAPLAPSHVKQLVDNGVRVLVQPSKVRTFNDMQYQKVGAIISEDLSSANTICAVKEIPVELLAKDKSYMFFSHTIKAQQVNMAMLDDILAKNIRLIDYETIKDDEGRRLVRFGKFAGYAGMIDTLHALGDRLLALGHSTPFLHVGLSYVYSGIDAAKEAVKAVGEEIGNYGIPEELSPLTFVFTSEGNVSRGAQEIFKCLPHKMITPYEMADLVKNKNKIKPSTFMVYGTVVNAEHYIVPNDPGRSFDKKDFYVNPHDYHSLFYERYAESISVLMNCMYWDPRSPRLITIEQIKELVEQKRSRLIAIGDISCDRMGSVEFLMKTTSIDQPIFIYDPITEECKDSETDHDFIYHPGVLFCAVDNFPTEFPKEATQWFGDHLIPFMEAIVRSDPSKPFEQMTDLPKEIHRAIITSHGKLAPKFEYINALRRENEKSLRSILMLGAGMVSAPCFDHLSRNSHNMITIADINIQNAEALAKRKRGVKAVTLDVKDQAALDRLISQHNVVICLVPAFMNPIIAEACMRCKKHLLTASYISPAMRLLNDQAVKENLLFLNEVGLDPGIDHMEARRVIDEVHSMGGKIRSFVSWCGGLPSPESSQNPLGYKFSWSPRGVLTASKGDAKYIQDGKPVQIDGKTLFKHVQNIDVFPGFSLEGVPNRDATIYADQYGITGEVETLFRGTLRYKGFSEVMEAIVDIGLLDETPNPILDPGSPELTWNELMRVVLHGEKSMIKTKHLLKKNLRTRNGFPSKGYDDDKLRRVNNALLWLGLFSDTPVVKKGNILDCLCDLLQDKLKYEKGETDMIILHHIFGIEWADGSKEIKTSTLVCHGDSDGMAMAKTVGLPIAIATDLVASGAISLRGVAGPMSPEIFKPMMKNLANEGIKFVEKSISARHLPSVRHSKSKSFG